MSIVPKSIGKLPKGRRVVLLEIPLVFSRLSVPRHPREGMDFFPQRVEFLSYLIINFGKVR